MVASSHAVPERVGPPIVVAPLALSELVCAGLCALLQPFRRRVQLLAYDGTSRYDIALVEPDLLWDHWRPPLDRPVVALARNAHSVNLAADKEWRLADVVGLDASGEELVNRLELVQRRSLNGVDHRGTSGHEILTAREAAILTRICRGASNQEIADELYLSLNSIKTYIRSAYRKMGVQSRTQAVLWGLEHGYETAGPHATAGGRQLIP
jgi:NarL family two-component system response regulator LiaR